MATLHTPDLKAIKFIGKFDKKLFELGGRFAPILKTDDVVVVTTLQAQLLTRTPHFEIVDIDTLFVNETSPVEKVLEAGVLNQEEITAVLDEAENEEYKLPFAEDIESLTIDEVKLACDFAGVTKGNKGIVKLKAMLLPYLPKKEQ